MEVRTKSSARLTTLRLPSPICISDDLEQLAYSLPSTQEFVRAITDDDDSGVKVVLLPDNVSREMVGRLVRNRLDSLRLDVSSLFHAGEASPVSASANAMSAAWPSASTLRTVHNLLRCESLPDLFYVHRIGSRSAWTEFIESWAREYGAQRASGNAGIPSLCVIAKLRDFDFDLPESVPGLTYHWWLGFPSMLELRLACRLASEQHFDDDPAAARWREYVIPGLVGSDVQLAEYMWDSVLGNTDHVIDSLTLYWESLERSEDSNSLDEAMEAVESQGEAYAHGQELPQHLHRLWAGGGLIYTKEFGLEVHPGLLAYHDRRASVENMLWRGQSELLLPVVNEIRFKLCRDFTATYGVDWPFKWARPSYSYDTEESNGLHLGAELGHINYLLQNMGMGDYNHELSKKRFLGNLVRQAKALRNQIAHNNPVSYQEFASLCEERGRVRI